jgi:ankyrin repeat protein
MADARRARNTQAEDPELTLAVRNLIRLFVVLGVLVAMGAVGGFLWFRQSQRGQKLIDAVEKNRPAEVQQLLASGVDANSASEGGVSALMLASLHGFKPIAEMLLQHGAKVNARDGRQQSALRLAGVDHPDLVKLLLEHGADPNARDFYGKTLLVAVCEAGASQDPFALRILLEHGADPNIAGDDGTPLVYAVHLGSQGNTDMVRLLLRHGANPDARDRSGTPVLASAVEKHNVEIIKALIDSKVSLNLTDTLGQTALKVAEQNQLTEIVALLKKAGGKE